MNWKFIHLVKQTIVVNILWGPSILLYKHLYPNPWRFICACYVVPLPCTWYCYLVPDIAMQTHFWKHYAKKALRNKMKKALPFFWLAQAKFENSHVFIHISRSQEFEIFLFCRYSEFHPYLFKQHQNNPFKEIPSFNKVRTGWYSIVVVHSLLQRGGK